MRTLVATAALLLTTLGASAQHYIADPGANIQNAMTVAVPAGWNLEGTIKRDIPCSPGDAFPTFRAMSPDGAYSVIVLTPFFTTSEQTNMDMSSCGTVAQTTSASEILGRYIAPQLRGGAQISAPEQLSSRSIIRTNTPTPPGFSEQHQAARVHVSGNNGEEYLVAYTTIVHAMGAPGSLGVTTVVIYHAPAGQLASFYQRAAGSIVATGTPAWDQRNNQIIAQTMQQIRDRNAQQQAAMQQQGGGGNDGGAAGRAMLARTRGQIAATGQASSNAAAASEAARHTSAVGTMNHVGDRPTQVYAFCNNSGGYTTNNNPNSPGPGWYPCRN